MILNLSRSRAAAAARRPSLTLLRLSVALALWIVGWTLIFSALDFWTIKLWDVCNRPWFQTYRAIMRYGVSWVSPPSFALAENAYFAWVNQFDRGRTMHEWDFYTGNPMNPDGRYNFVWGDNNGGWVRFPMETWYLGWLLPTVPWFMLVLRLFRPRGAPRPLRRPLAGLAPWPPLALLPEQERAEPWYQN